jgi:hypothetical protein
MPAEDDWDPTPVDPKLVEACEYISTQDLFKIIQLRCRFLAAVYRHLTEDDISHWRQFSTWNKQLSSFEELFGGVRGLYHSTDKECRRRVR